MLKRSGLLQSLKNVLCVLLLGFSMVSPAKADYVGELETTKYFDQTTIDLIQTRLGQGTGLLAGDEISYFIQFTPTDNGGLVGGGGFVTDYIPAGTQVTGAQFVRLNGDGTYTQIAPPSPAAMLPYYVPFYSDTGIFYSTDARTAQYFTGAGTDITAANGYATIGGGCKGSSLPSTTHNAWDSAMVTTFEAAARDKNGTCAAPPATTYSAATAINGLSPVAGPDTYLAKDSTGAVGPWQRIAYPGSYNGTRTGTYSGNDTSGDGVQNECVGGVPTSAGYSLSASTPLPPNTTAVRFAAGKVTVGELFSVRISLKLTSNMPVGGLVNNSEVFGGDASLDPGSDAGKDNHWKYHCPAVAVSNSNLLLVKTLVGACAGVGCVPTAITAGVVPSVANLKLRYNIQYLNLGGTAQTNVVMKDTLAAGGAYVAGSALQLSGTAIGVPTTLGTAPQVMSFPTIATLGSGSGGKIQYDVSFAAAPAAGKALINTANMVSTQVPAPGVTSKSIATASTEPNLWIGKSASTSSVAPGGTVSYTITIPNNGAAAVTATAANPVTVIDSLPTSGLGLTAADRFSYVAGSVVAQTWTAAGIATAATPAVTVTAPATAAAREQVSFKLTAGTIPMGGKLTLTFNALVGSNVPASATPYLNDASVDYFASVVKVKKGKTTTTYFPRRSETIGVAPVTVTAPMSISVKVDCVYAGATCVPYTSGSIPPGAKIKYRVDYKNISAAALSGMVLTDTLPANVSFVAGSAKRAGSVIADPTAAGQVLTFSSTSLTAGASEYVTFDAQLGAAIVDGDNITNTVKMTATTFAAGVTANVTSSVRNQAKLSVTKTVTPSTVGIGGTVTYTVTVTNTGSVSASNIKVYDLLPYAGTAADATKRFNYTAAGTTPFTTDDTSASKLLAVTPTTSVPPTFTGYTGHTNRQQVLWTFAAAKQLAAGKSFTLTYTATAGSAMVSSTTPYTSDVAVEYISATVPASAVKHDFAYSAAPVTIGGLDHILITHDGSGLTCTPSTVKLTACANDTCTAPHFTGGVSVTLTPGGQTFTIGATGELTSATVAQTTAGSVNQAVSSSTPAASYATTCLDTSTSTSSCTMTFADAGFIFSAAAGGTEVTFPTQTAGVSSATYQLRAVKKSTTTQACEGALSGVQTVNFAYECNDPTTCAATNDLKVNGTAVAGNNNTGGIFGGYNYTGVDLTFDANGNAPFSFAYGDVGKVSLYVKKASVGTQPLLTGNSNAPFIVKPFNFKVLACPSTTVGDCTAANASPVDGSGAVFARAGETFKATISALASGGAVTKSFGTADAATKGSETVALSRTRAAPTFVGAVDGAALGGTSSISRGSFSNGVATVSDLTWDEVGVITLTATNANFMGIASGATGSSGNVGRFVPAWFVTVATGQMACPGALVCPAGRAVYSGQVFASAQVTAMNAAGAQTQNYAGAFAHKVTLSAVNGVAGNTAAADGAIGGTVDIAAASFAGGSATINGALATNTGAPLFNFAATPTAPTDVYLRAVESSGSDAVASGPAGKTTQGGLKVVSGRLKVPNAYGSNLLPLNLTATAQYFTGTGWNTSATDNVTTLVLAGPLLVGGKNSVVTLANAGVLSTGQLIITLGAPAANATGAVAVAPAVTGGYLPVSGGLATFGIYKSGNQFIYQREAY